MYSEGLGRIFDFGIAWAPVDLNTADGATGKRISMAGAAGITFLVATGTGGADDIVLDVQQHTAYTSGTSADLDATAVTGSVGVDHWWIKAETALDGDEIWVAITQTAASECTVVGATYGAQQKLISIYVPATALADGYSHVSLNAAVTTSTAQLGVGIYVLHDLSRGSKPSLRPNLLRPGAANA
jgi:hypothetical protein